MELIGIDVQVRTPQGKVVLASSADFMVVPVGIKGAAWTQALRLLDGTVIEINARELPARENTDGDSI